MSDFGPVGVEALTLAWQEWLAWSWVLLPPVGFALVALVVRLRVAARARFRLTDGVEGRWHDGSECLAGWFEVEGSEASEPVGVARYGRLAKSHAALPPPVFSRPVVFRTADGRSVAFPAGAALTFQSQKDERHGHHVHVGSQEAEPATTTPGRRDVLHVHEIVVTPGQPVWLRGPAPLCGPWDYRSAPQPELDKLTVIFTAPSPPETRIEGAYLLVWITAVLAVLFPFADAARAVFLGIDALCVLATVKSLHASKDFARTYPP